VTRPNAARIYDCLLGGKDNFQADRAEAWRLLEACPAVGRLARENRGFLARAVRWLASQGIRQFIDIGPGLPTTENTHQAARSVDPSCRVVYADNDPVVVAHARALMSVGDAVAIEADLRHPASVFAHPLTRELIRDGEPTAVILALVLHFLDADTAGQVVAAVTSWLPAGSYAVVSVAVAERGPGEVLAREYTAARVYHHPPRQVEGFFGGTGFVPPGLVDAVDWEPCASPPPPAPSQMRVLAGVWPKPAANAR
jgi:hypothetical protein